MNKLKNICSAMVLLLACMSVKAQTLQWYDPATAQGIGGRGWQNSMANAYDRLPQKAEQMVRPAVWKLAQNSAGLYLDFKTSATTIVVRYKVKGNQAMPHMPATGVSGVDLYAQDEKGQWQWASAKYKFGDTIEYRYTNLIGAQEKTFRLYLPLYNSVSWMQIGANARSAFTFLPPDAQKPIVAYGTSIMQEACASRPGLAWTNLLNRQLDRPVINLGFSGNGELEEPLISLLNEIDAQLFILDCMPNLVLGARFSREEVQKRIRTSVSALQAKHPQTPILLAEHCCGLPGTNLDTAMVNKYAIISEVVASTFKQLQKEGVKNIYLLTAKEIGFTYESTVDGTHPNDLGMKQYADAYEAIIRKILQLKP